METERKRRFIINTIYFGIIIAAALVLIKYVLPLLTPFVVAFVIAWVMRRPTRMLVKKFNLPHKPVALVMVLLFYCTAGTLIALLAVKLFTGVRDLILRLPQLYTTYLLPLLTSVFSRMEGWIYQLDENLFALIQGFDDEFLSWLASLISGISGKAVGAASSFAASIPGLFIQIVLMIISTFFIAADYNIMRDFVRKQMGEKATALFEQIKQYLVGTLFVCIGSYFIIAMLTFVELSIGLSIIGVNHSVLIALFIAVFDILPVLGTGGIMVPWTVLSLLQGNYTRALGLLVVYVAITVIRNVVEPKIVGGKLGLHPVVTLASMFAGVKMLGFVGLFGFPIGLSLLRYLNDNGTIKWLKTDGSTKEDAAEGK